LLEGATPLLRKSYPLRGGHAVAVDVFRGAGGEQVVRVRTDVAAAAPLLHWGVEGGRDYKGGWRLPGGGVRPPGTRQYKDRALQTPFDKASGGEGGDNGAALTLVLAGDEASDALNFVIKDEATDTWWDHNGANFRVPLRVELATASMLDGVSAGNGSVASAAVSAAAAAAIAAASASPSPSSSPRPTSALDDESDLPQLSEQLCDTWAWVRWDQAGRPQRSAALADADYGRAVAEMSALLRAGRPLEELWRVARGEMPYAAYKIDVIDKTLGGEEAGARPRERTAAAPSPVSAPAVAPRPPDGSRVDGPPLSIPEELVAVQAYLLWEQAGKPQGADFGADARKVIERQLREGKTLQEVEAVLRGGGDQGGCAEDQERERQERERRERKQREKQQQQEQEKQQRNEAAAAAAAAAAAPAPAAAPANPPGPPASVIGESLGLGAARDPLALIKPKSPAPGATPAALAAAAAAGAAPSLSEDKHRRQARPLDPVVQAAALDPSTRWRRTFQLPGGRAQLLAVVKQRRSKRGGKGKEGEEEDGDMVVTLITDAADDVVLHWGASPAGNARKWARPPKTIRPGGTVETATGEACETAFGSCGRPGADGEEEGCRVDGFYFDESMDESMDEEVAGKRSGGGAAGAGGERTDDGGNETLGRAFLRASSLVPLQRVAVRVPASAHLCGLTFVLRSADGTRWYNDAGGGNFFVPLPFRSAAGAADAVADDAALAAAAAGLRTPLERAIVDAEVNSSMWTLMHRYNRAAELLEQALDGGVDITAPALAVGAGGAAGNGNGNGNGDADTLPALEGEQAVAQACSDIYVWLRYSATRQLTWQRNYNTQPRILSAAQERLTRAVGAAHAKTHGEAQEWCRMMLTTVGRGGDGQRIRDEILHIMHR
jgi:alpha-glucan,water dikinase